MTWDDLVVFANDPKAPPKRDGAGNYLAEIHLSRERFVNDVWNKTGLNVERPRD